MKLENIGFYTLTDERAKNTSWDSPMQRCEMIVTDHCNFNCPYCRGLRNDGDIDLEVAFDTLDEWCLQGLKNVRFSGGEPTLYPFLINLVARAKKQQVERIAISTNGSARFSKYDDLIHAGANDFSISLDACCASDGDIMAGVGNKWNRVKTNIRQIAKRTYVTVGVVLTGTNADNVVDIIHFAHDLGVADIRLVAAAQNSKLELDLSGIRPDVLDAHPILKYRVEHYAEGRNVRGIQESDCHKCHLAKDDSVVSGNYHFPCVIYMREGGKPIGEVGNMRPERKSWFELHNSYDDPICKANCLDVCIDYNNKAEELCRIDKS